MVLEGMVPVLMQTPPTTERASTTATRLFILAAATAARCPAGPEPMTTRSYLTALMRVSLQGVVLPIRRRDEGAGTGERISLPGGYHSGRWIETGWG